MRNLLSAGLMRMRRSAMFWCCCMGVFLASLSVGFSGGEALCLRQETAGVAAGLEYFYFEPVPFLGAAIAVFVSFFLGTEYSDGAIRNKLIVGLSRREVYLSNLTISMLAGVSITACWMLGGLSGLFWVDGFHMGQTELMGHLLAALALGVSFAAIFTLVSMLCRNKALTVVLVLLVWLVLLLIGSGLYDRLLEPEMQGGLAMIDGKFVMIDETPNPLYLTGTARTVIQWLFRILPTGQAIAITDARLETPFLCAALSLALAWAVTMVGLALFKRKDLK